MSPAAVINAYTDWLLQLAVSPARQADLMAKARSQGMGGKANADAALADAPGCYVLGT